MLVIMCWLSWMVVLTPSDSVLTGTCYWSRGRGRTPLTFELIWTANCMGGLKEPVREGGFDLVLGDVISCRKLVMYMTWVCSKGTSKLLHVYVYVCVCTHTYIHIHMHTYTHTCIKCRHTYTQLRLDTVVAKIWQVRP